MWLYSCENIISECNLQKESCSQQQGWLAQKPAATHQYLADMRDLSPTGRQSTIFMLKYTGASSVGDSLKEVQMPTGIFVRATTLELM